MKYIVENYDTDEVIEEFDSDDKRNKWISENVDENGYMKNGIKVSIYEK